MAQAVVRRQIVWFVAAVLIFIAAGRVAISAVMAFKYNRPLQPGFVAPGPKGDNWLALPYAGLYPDAKSLCTAFGAVPGISVAILNPATGVFTSVNCPANIGSFALPPGWGVRVRVVPAAPANVVLVGAHSDAVLLPDVPGGWVAPGPRGDTWIALPWHSIYRNARDLCAGYAFAFPTEISRMNAATGLVQSCTCPCAIASPALNMGEAVRIRKSSPGVAPGFIPPHY